VEVAQIMERKTKDCFGKHCAGCKDFFICPEHWGEEDDMAFGEGEIG